MIQEILERFGERDISFYSMVALIGAIIAMILIVTAFSAELPTFSRNILILSALTIGVVVYYPIWQSQKLPLPGNFLGYLDLVVLLNTGQYQRMLVLCEEVTNYYINKVDLEKFKELLREDLEEQRRILERQGMPTHMVDEVERILEDLKLENIRLYLLNWGGEKILLLQYFNTTKDLRELGRPHRTFFYVFPFGLMARTITLGIGTWLKEKVYVKGVGNLRILLYAPFDVAEKMENISEAVETYFKGAENLSLLVTNVKNWVAVKSELKILKERTKKFEQLVSRLSAENTKLRMALNLKPLEPTAVDVTRIYQQMHGSPYMVAIAAATGSFIVANVYGNILAAVGGALLGGFAAAFYMDHEARKVAK
ncbi:MAG: hypothetical protein DRJ38_04005 [Thermoprotei archaeon]|nr:MAG: hypothetical protein DRJ38_04005 [Thermoprotei archaeon]